ncbi:MAG: hypothetical protein D6756_04465 [Cyanobacteria bacterium J083]|nr:MAG: hypothetical protein D6756_04465 [Cyanobacteria bacterium J083]
MQIVICPGIHKRQLTNQFLSSMAKFRHSREKLDKWLVFPTEQQAPYNPLLVNQFVTDNCDNSSILLIAFSAGVVGALGTAWLQQIQGREIRGLIALDGWGVPLGGNFPIYRLSHDYFTHLTSKAIGVGVDSFYAEPAVEHLDLWAFPANTWGWWEKSGGTKVRCLAAEFISIQIRKCAGDRED